MEFIDDSNFNDYVEKVMPEIKEAAKQIEETETDWKALNELFFQIIDN